MPARLKLFTDKIKLRTWIALGVISLLIPIALLALFRPTSPDAAWYDDSYGYRKKIIFTHDTDISDDRRLSVAVDTAALTTDKMQADCDDTRFTDVNGRVLSYQLVSGCDTTTTQYDVIINPTINGANILYIYYGNPSAVSASIDVSSVTAVTPSGGNPALGSEEKGSGPVSYWALNDATGGTANDSTSNNNDGTLGASTAAPSWQQEELCVAGKCLLFDGSNDVVTVANTVSGVQTVAFWVKAMTTSEQFIDLNGTASISASSGTVSATNFTSPTIYVDGQTGSTISASRWHYVVVTTGTGISASAIKLGQISTNFGQIFIDDVKLYNYARSADQIKADFNARGGTDAASVRIGGSNQKFLSDGLVGFWKLDNTSGNATDSSGNALTLTNNGTTTYTYGKFSRGSEHVPASSQYLSTATTISGIKTVSFWTNPDSTTNYYTSLTSSAYITSSSGTLAATGFTSPKIYVNGVESSTVVADVWQQVTIVTDTAINANSFYIGRQDTNYYDGTIDGFRLYNRALSPAEVQALYNFAPGPIAYWPLNENTDNTCTGGTNDVCDRSGSALNGAITGATWGTGKFGSALNFDGDDYIDHNEVLDLRGHITIGLWVKTSSSGTNRAIFSRYGNNTRHKYRVYMNTSGQAVFERGQSATWINSVTGTSSINDNNWHYITAVFDFVNMSIYVDGVLENQTAETRESDSLNNFDVCIGDDGFDCGASYGHTPWLGSIDEVVVYEYARSNSQIVEDMNGGHPLGGSPIGSQVVHWRFDEQQGSTANNAVFGGTNGTISNATWRTKSVCKNNGCLSYDGTGDVVTIAQASDGDVDFNGSQSFSGSAWVYPTSIQGSATEKRAIISKYDATTPARGYRLYLENDDTDSTGNFEVEIYDESADQVITASSPTDGVSANTWYHVTFTFNGGTAGAANDLKIYLDGREYANSANTSFLGLEDAGADFTIGEYDATDAVAANTGFIGYIDEIKIYGGLLTTSQVQVDMNSGSSLNFGGQSNEASQVIDGAGSPPVGEWKFDEKTGLSANDTSGNGNTGTLTGGPTWVKGKLGQAIEFYGDNDTVSVGNVASLGFERTDDFTMSAWIKTTLNSGQHIISKQDHNSAINRGYAIQTGGSGYIFFQAVNTYNSNALEVRTSNDVGYYDGKWHHVLVTYDGSSSPSGVKIYFDGVSQTLQTTQNTLSATISNSGSFHIGSRNGSELFFRGSIDNAKIYDYDLTQAQSVYDYNRGAPIGHWRFDECQGATAYDSSGNDNHGTIDPGDNTGANDSVGTCTGSAGEMWADGASGKLNSSLDFDGTNDSVQITDSANTYDLNDDFSFGSWVKSTTTATTIVMSRGTTNDWQYALVYNITPSDGKAYCKIYQANSGNGYLDVISTTTVNDGNWHNIFCVLSSSTLTIYVDGKAAGTDSTATGTKDTDSAGELYISKLDWSTPYHLPGQIDDVRIYSYALSADQVKQINNKGAVYFGPSSGQP